MEGFPLYDPATTRQDATGKWIRDPFVGNQIPVSRFDTVSKNLLSYNPGRSPTGPAL